ncbi:MAG: carbohydrate-binding family 9-like protein [Litorilinea sp.]
MAAESGAGGEHATAPWPWPAAEIARYTAYRTPQPLTIDGRLDKPAWQAVPRSPRFRDLVHGTPARHNTQAAVLWDADFLYVGYWIEEPVVAARHTQRDAPIYEDNDIELFIAGPHAYYELEINALGTIYEAFFVWDDAYVVQGFAEIPELQQDVLGYRPWVGVGFQPHPRGPRHGFFGWDLPGLQWGVWVDGVVNDGAVRDRGWTVEIAVPWQGLTLPARGQTLPPAPGDVWRMDFSRFNQYKAAPPAQDSGAWAWSPHGVWDSHVPEVFPYITFSDETV